MLDQQERDRFDSKWIVEDRGFETPCHIWTGWVDPKTGYGIFRVRQPRKKVKAHRYAYLKAHGEIPFRNVNHRCNQRDCVNPDHLYSGTQKENVADTLASGHHKQANQTHCSICGLPLVQMGRKRGCRPCQLRRQAEWRERHRNV